VALGDAGSYAPLKNRDGFPHDEQFEVAQGNFPVLCSAALSWLLVTRIHPDLWRDDWR
jgi:hypothetical protein